MEMSNEIKRIRAVYKDRTGKRNLYAWWQPDIQLQSYTRNRAATALLRGRGWDELSNRSILDVGCGTGVWLQTLVTWGATPGKLAGTDLLPDRIEVARQALPQSNLVVPETWAIPFGDNKFDMVCANTVLSSILDGDARIQLALEMGRVLAEDGSILIYDFRISHPSNPNTRGIPLKEIKRLFPDYKVYAKSVTLLPPIQRVTSKLMPLLSLALETWFPFLRSHIVYLLYKDLRK